MLLLFGSFLLAFVSHQRKKLQYHKNLQAIQQQQQDELRRQNALLEQRVTERTAQLQQQKEALQNTLAELKTSQLQLVQKEKMASLGELTAGIAHEIQNPLNFVNNFAEINTELLTEMQELFGNIAVPDAQAKELNALLKDITENLHKIAQHGKRADNIVKNMLLHSRQQSGHLELTDINELTQENLMLAYHGYRAKDKTFNCNLQTTYDEHLPLIKLIPGDIGRILVNLLNNAFYSINKKRNQAGPAYQPTVSLSTQKTQTGVSLTIRDNGLGISQKFIDKIYEPFFTTKPTGEGTGLGLSMSYDIIKAHQGDLKVTSTEGEFAEFCIELKA